MQNTKNLIIYKDDIGSIKYRYLIYSVSLLPILILPFSPLIAYVLSLLFLILGTSFLDGLSRYALAATVILSMSIIVSSRVVFAVKDDDFIRYYALYRDLSLGDIDALFRYGGGIEIGLPLLYLLFDWITPKASPQLLLFEGSVSIIFLYYFWIEKYGVKFFNESQKAFIVAVSLLLFEMYDTTQLVRQMFSMVILLYAISSNSMKGKILFFFIATIFHTTAIIYFLIIEGIKKYPKAMLISSVILGILFILSFEILMSLFISGAMDGFFVASKFEAYEYANALAKTTFIQDFRILLVAVLFIFVKSDNTVIYNWKYFVFVFTFIYLASLQLPISPVRASLIYSDILLGYLLTIVLLNKRILFMPSISLFLVYKFYSLGNTGISNKYWYSYDWIGIQPFYFLF